VGKNLRTGGGGKWVWVAVLPGGLKSASGKGKGACRRPIKRSTWVRRAPVIDPDKQEKKKKTGRRGCHSKRVEKRRRGRRR